MTIDGGIRANQGELLQNPQLLPGENNYVLSDGKLTAITTINSEGQLIITDDNSTYFNPEDLTGDNEGFDPRANDSPYEIFFVTGVFAGTSFSVVENSVNGDSLAILLSGSEFTYNDLDWPIGLDGEKLLPTDNDEYVFRPVNRNELVDEAVQVDVISVFNGESPSNDVGTLTENHISGFGMADSSIIDGTIITAGIHYNNIETLNIELGSGNDQLSIESTHLGTTNVLTGSGDDQVFVKTISGQTFIDGEAGNDDVIVSSDDMLVDQVMALLTVNGGGSNDADIDTLTVDDSKDTNDNTLWLGKDSLTGLDMPSIPEVQLISMQADSGSFDLTLGDTVLGDYGTISLDWNVSLADIEAELLTLINLAHQDKPSFNAGVMISVDGTVNDVKKTYRVQFTEDLAGIDMTQMVMSNVVLSAPAGFTPKVSVTTSINGGNVSSLDQHVFMLEMPTSAGSFTFNILGEDLILSNTISEDDLFTVLDPVLNPNNQPDRISTYPTTDSFQLRKLGSTFMLILQGEHKDLLLNQSNITTGDVIITQREAGINYYNLDNLLIELGSGSDDINVQATTNTTNINGNDGDDSIYISSLADSQYINAASATGTLDGINKTLNLDAGAGHNALYISDFDSTVADDHVVLTDNALTNLSIGDINYSALGGDFDNGLVIWTGKGSDIITVDSVYDQSISITKLYTNEGEDHITVVASDDLNNPNHDILSTFDRRLDIFSQAGVDTIDASTASLAIRVDGGEDKDYITGGLGDDVLLGATGNDEISGGKGDDFIDGQLGHDTLYGNEGNDEIYGREGNDIIRGMSGMDTIYGNIGLDIIFGENGNVLNAASGEMLAEELVDANNLLLVRKVISTDVTVGDDIITDLIGDTIIIGGAGKDTITTLNDNDVIIGDNGEIIFSSTGIIESLTVNDLTHGDNDIIDAGNGNNIIAGATGDDDIDSGINNDIILGDGGELTFTAGVLTAAQSTNAESGNDTITVADGDNFILGGAGQDSVTAGDGNDVIIGDNGELARSATGIVELVNIDDMINGDNDIIDAGNGNNIVTGGLGDDEISSGTGNDAILGDGGVLTLTNGVLTNAKSTVSEIGNDTITVADGDNVILGGAGQDSVTAGDGDDVIIGDNGQLTYVLTTSSATIESIVVTDLATGGNDIIDAGNGNNIIVGATGDDDINAGFGNDTIIADGGTLLFSAGILTSAESIASIQGNDSVDVAGGNNVILAGAGKDQISTGAGEDIILGDTGEIIFDSNLLKSIFTSNQGVQDDQISSGDGADIIFAGLGSDTISSGGGDDIVIADTGSIETKTTSGFATLLRNDYDGNIGGNDTVYLGDGNDIVLGGAGKDFLDGGDGEDAIFGDFAVMSASNAGVRDFQSTLPTFGDSDTIIGGTGFDILVGGNGYDIFHGSLKEDLIVGNYARIKDNPDFSSLLVVSDPSNREVISASMFNLYGITSWNFDSQYDQENTLFSEYNYELSPPLRTDTALRLTPLLNGEELLRLSDNELKDFLRNLPLLPIDNNHADFSNSEQPSNEENNNEELLPDNNEKIAEEFSNHSILKVIEETQSVDSIQSLSHSDNKLLAINKVVNSEDSNTLKTNSFLSEKVAVSLLIAASVANRRGWKLTSPSNEKTLVCGDLQDLRHIQSSRKFDVWKK